MMNIKFGLVAGAAVACVVMSGCKAPKTQSVDRPVRPVPRIVKPTPVPAPVPKAVKPVPAPVPAPAPEPLRCKCVPGTVHTSPCACGASDCKCKVKPAEPEYTLYRVKGGDILSAICVTYGLKQSKVLELNPGLNPNKLFVGKKIKLPGKIDLKDADAKSLAKQPVAKKQAKSTKASSAKVSSYKGATKEYVVKSGDSLGKIAYSNGITIKCLKEMNGLKKNTIRVGQKLKIPAEKPVAAAKSAPSPAKSASAPVADQKPASDAPVAESKPTESAPEVTAPVAPAPVEAAPSAPDATPAVAEPVKEEAPAAETASALTHTVKEGEDTVSIAIMYGVSPSAVMDLNDLKNTDSLKVGQVLKLPANAKVQ
ncbi:MAG: LysM peptidoglycan-binding domain-containing protein [Kiritimatiellae bacterium]|nr:LysM peptidoglycan-binding domain-containing protein [Kiritimatiellia bacterium]